MPMPGRAGGPPVVMADGDGVGAVRRSHRTRPRDPISSTRPAPVHCRTDISQLVRLGSGLREFVWPYGSTIVLPLIKRRAILRSDRGVAAYPRPPYALLDNH